MRSLPSTRSARLTSRDDVRLLAIFSSRRSVERMRMRIQISGTRTTSPTIVTTAKLMLGLLGYVDGKNPTPFRGKGHAVESPYAAEDPQRVFVGRGSHISTRGRVVCCADRDTRENTLGPAQRGGVGG